MKDMKFMKIFVVYLFVGPGYPVDSTTYNM